MCMYGVIFELPNLKIERNITYTSIKKKKKKKNGNFLIFFPTNELK
jgi:hypothetical protein